LGRKPLITDGMKIAIAIAFRENRYDKIATIRQIASKRCGKEISRSVIEREILRLRTEHPKGITDPMDNQWSLASLRLYPIDPQVIPFLLYLQDSVEFNNANLLKLIPRFGSSKIPFLTNRLAIWISHLFSLVIYPKYTGGEASKIWIPPSTATKNLNRWPEWVVELIETATWYSNYEIGCELAGIYPISTIRFDAPTIDRIKANILRYSKDII
jgi:hypothetical protein